jgi:hypothetical protein
VQKVEFEQVSQALEQAVHTPLSKKVPVGQSWQLPFTFT